MPHVAKVSAVSRISTSLCGTRLHADWAGGTLVILPADLSIDVPGLCAYAGKHRADWADCLTPGAHG